MTLPLPVSLRELLPRCLARARQPVPRDMLRFMLNEQAIGWVRPSQVALLRACWPELEALDGADGHGLPVDGTFVAGALRWHEPSGDRAIRSARIGAVAQALREQGAITGWRDERYDCEQPVGDPCAARGTPLFQLERAAFRFFGLMSRAVHINGSAPQGHLVCGRRSLSKATDPGKLDNLAAGGLPEGEDPLACARRELWEEAGVPTALSAALAPRGQLRSTRLEPEGLHDEVLHVYSLGLPADFSPANQDGEVSGFVTLPPEALAQHLADDNFSIDAAAVVAWELRHPEAAPQKS